MPKNIVVCCDGTTNKLTINENTNVIHLYSCLEKSNRQTTYYHPGVGTIAPIGVTNWIARGWYVIKDMVSASSLEENVKDAYRFLMDNYEDGDEIYLFGFSRGAYSVRMLSGLIEMFGLLQKGNFNHLRYAFEIYSRGKSEELFPLANTFKSRFSREVPIRFMGIWDTVVAAGGLIDFYKSFPYSRSLGIVATVRHAVAIDERRKHYYYYEVSPKHTDCNEVFFAGVHSDVGGSYSKEGLSKVTLEWILGEASNNGLILSKEKVEKYVYGKKSNYQKPDFAFRIHNSLTFGFKIFDLIPRARYNSKSWFYKMSLDCRLWPKRTISDNALIHESVYKKMAYKSSTPPHTEHDKIAYLPTNLKKGTGYYQIVKSQPIKWL